MALVDYEGAWQDLAVFIASKPHHGSRDLALKMLELAAVHAEDESMPERALRLYGIQLHEDLRAAARQDPVVREPQQDHSEFLTRGSPASAETGGPAHLTTVGGHDVSAGHDHSRCSHG